MKKNRRDMKAQTKREKLYAFAVRKNLHVFASLRQKNNAFMENCVAQFAASSREKSGYRHYPIFRGLYDDGGHCRD
jgi:hypothetical protein